MMERKITIGEFSTMLATQAGVSTEEASVLVKLLFHNVSATLQKTGKAEIYGIGSLRVEEGDVVFTPLKEFASKINAPFESFTPERLSSDYVEETIEQEADNDVSEALNEDIDSEVAESAELEQCEEAETENGDAVVNEEPMNDAGADENADNGDIDTVGMNSEVNVIIATPETIEIEEKCEVTVVAAQMVETGMPDIQKQGDEMPPVPQVTTTETEEKTEEDSRNVSQTPPPFNPVSVYDNSKSTAFIPEDEEVFVDNVNVSGSTKFLNGLICGVVIMLAIIALAAAAYVLLK